MTGWTKWALTALALITLLVGAFTSETAASLDTTVVAQADGAQNPFGTRTPPSAAPAPGSEPGPFGRFWNWIQQTQQQLYRELAGGVRTLKEERAFSAGLALVLLSFFYGVVHAIGPGHGKAVISSYALANERTARRGIILAFGSSFVQALSAIVLVGVMAILLNAAGLSIRERVGELETLSYALVAVVGAVMLVAAVRRILRRRTHADRHDHAHDDECCGHAHMPDPSTLQGTWSWRSAAAIMLAVGVRPCTGAIVVLVFALTQGLFWAGILSTFAMSLGTAITVSVLAAAAVGSRELAARAGGTGSLWAERVQTVAALGGGFVVMMLGVVLFAASLGPARPF
ncbi:nickel/cobalt transporter [Dichotomicrobium thermohalophilum]|uniref:Nickel/cobalt efflux system n=1 Tax=Dichotomicrobium thermohalophilum TaxID=933063 RepID=A0A397Q340_9HYPH|nr:nickel/cobalt transporter [Dichotomicrobium thermohalophilum]RIA55542.1 ABC-type nickel/cobalt efflux system permease component RcnA [Dichotomicrobium thermohalophilum]